MLNFADESLSPGKINLYRFLFPRLKLFDMVSAGINPAAMTAAEMKLSFFNGNGLWLKGDIHSWYSPEVRAFITKAHRALREHAEAFTSDHTEPLVPTAAPGILTNRFHQRGRPFSRFTTVDSKPFEEGFWKSLRN